MALLTKVGAQGRRFLTGDRLRTWWALRCQKRRRSKAPVGPPPCPPAILDAYVVEDVVWVDWEYDGPEVCGFKLYHDADYDGRCVMVGGCGPEARSFLDNTVVHGASFRFWVVAWNTAGEAWSDAWPLTM